MARGRDDEEELMRIGEAQLIQSMPVIGEVVTMGNAQWRCVMVAYYDEHDGKRTTPEIRVYYRQEADVDSRS